MAQLLRRLLQRFGGHEGVGDAGRACGDGDDPGAARRGVGRNVGSGFIDLGLLRRLAQEMLGIGQGLGRGTLKQALAGKTAQVQRPGVDHQHPVGRGDHGL
ncbi:hypothetical protein D3C77_370430 [compost metagenome]